MKLTGRRIVVTGLGVVTALGTDVDAVFDALCRGETGIRPIRRFDVSHCPAKVGGIIEHLDPLAIITDRAGRRLLRSADWIQTMALCAAELACTSAGLAPGSVAPDRWGVFMGAGRGGVEAMRELIEAMHRLFDNAGQDVGDRRVGEAIAARAALAVNPVFHLQQCPCLVSAYVAMRYQARGPMLTNVNLCSAGAQAIGEAAWTVARGDADVMLAGGADSMLNSAELTAFCALDAVSTNVAAGAAASRPFDRRRDGCVVGEGAAVLVLEELGHARRRGARVHAELLGYGTSSDAYKVSAPLPDGAGAVLAMRQALAHAGLPPEAVDHVNAHGTSTPLNDRIETQAIKTVLGPHAYRIPVVSTKGMTGHLIAGAGALDAMVAVKSIGEKRVPPTKNLEVPDPQCDLDYVSEGARQVPALRTVLSNSFAIGGSNACLVFADVEAAA